LKWGVSLVCEATLRRFRPGDHGQADDEFRELLAASCPAGIVFATEALSALRVA
jgi:hypothetical protein